MKAMILAAGEGTRLRPLTDIYPKPMLPVGGQPLLERTVGWLRAHGIAEIAINLHHRPEAITRHFGDGSRFGVRITYSPEEQLLGTAGAVRRLEGFFDTTFAVVYGDVLTDLDLTALAAFHAGSGSVATLALYRADPQPTARGLVALSEQGRVTRFLEKPRSEEVFDGLINAGVYILEPAVVPFIPIDRPSDFGRDVFPDLLQRGMRLSGWPIPPATTLIDIGSPESYRAAQQMVMGSP
jgi:NDP-sugar pyrophosphorylase family protein